MDRVLFVQLPPPRFIFEEAPSNIPLAAGFLSSALEAGHLPGIEVSILGPEIVDTLADTGLIESIVQTDPQIVAFSLYVWNVQRSLFIAAGLKRRLTDVKILVGGPEVTADNRWVLEHPALDAGVFGEGESRIGEMVAALLNEGNLDDVAGTFHKSGDGLQMNLTAPASWDPGCVPYPYLNGKVTPSRDGTLFLETVRGCPFQCRYCYYHKAFGSVRSHPAHSVREVIRQAYSENSPVREIYLMDPTFNATPGFSDILQYIASLRRSDCPKLHTELRADLLCAEDVMLLRKAGLASAEVGLQTTNPDARRIAARTGAPEKIAHGVTLLKDSGIEVTTGIIAGLPGDSPNGFSSTLTWLRRTEAYSTVHPFVLSVLPGTDFRASASGLDLAYDRRPPYYVVSTRTFSAEDLRSALLECEEAFEMEIDYIPPPSLVDSGPGVISQPEDAQYVNKWIVNPEHPESMQALARLIPKATDPFTFWFRGIRCSDSARAMLRILNGFVQANPHTVLHIVLEFDAPPEKSFLDRAIEVTALPGTYVNRSYQPLYGQGEVVTPCFTVIYRNPCRSDVRDAIRAEYESFATIVWDESDALGEHLDQLDPPLLISASEQHIERDGGDLLELLCQKHREHPHEIRFRDATLQRNWERMTRGIGPEMSMPEQIVVTV